MKIPKDHASTEVKSKPNSAIVKVDTKAPPELSAADKKRAVEIAREIETTEALIRNGCLVVQKGTITIGHRDLHSAYRWQRQMFIIDIFWMYFNDDY